MEQTIDQLKKSLLSVDHAASNEILQRISNELTYTEIIDKIIMPVMDQIGLGWEDGTVALSQVYMTGKFTEKFVDSILPPGDPNRKHKPKMAITVLEDYHMLGKRIIYSMLRASGFELYDYGHTTVNSLFQKIKDDDINTILISTLMLPSALKIKELKAKLIAENMNTRVIVGGAPYRFDNQLWKDVGADAMASGANEVISIINGNGGQV